MRFSRKQKLTISARTDAHTPLEETHTECRTLKFIVSVLDLVTEGADLFGNRNSSVRIDPSCARADHKPVLDFIRQS